MATIRDKVLESKIDNCIAEIELFKLSTDEAKYLEYLFRIKVDPHFRSIDALHEAFCMNYFEIVKKLMYRFPELHTADNVICAHTFIMQYKYSDDIPKFMLTLGIEIDIEQLKNAIHSDQVGLLKLL